MRETLIDAALAHLDQGVEFGLRAVARAAGVSAMAPYRHFADRDALLAAVAERGFERLREKLIEADSAADPAEALLAQGVAYVAFALDNPALFRLMFTGPAPGKLPGSDTAYGVLAARVRSIAPEGEEAGVLACWGAVHGIATLALDGRLAPPLETQTRAALRLMVDGLLSRSPPAGSSSPVVES